MPTCAGSVRFMPFDFHASYEQLNTADDDYRFYAHLAHWLDAHRVVDLGCGNGVLARMIAAQGHHVTGIEPDSAMLDVARRKDTSGEITWVHGHSDQAPPPLISPPCLDTSPHA